jgi:hypothetical protein
LIVLCQEAVDCGLKVNEGAERSLFEPPLREFCEEALHGLEPATPTPGFRKDARLYLEAPPIVCAFLAFVILAATALANWYAPFRKKVSYWLTQQDNELVAAAEAQPTLFALNAFFLYVAAIFLAVFCLSVFG